MKKYDVSLKDTSELRKLILENPELPLMIFCNEDCHGGQFSYELARVVSCEVQELYLFRSEWLNKDEYADMLSYDLADEKENRSLSDKEFDDIIADTIKRMNFLKAIVVYVGEE